MGETALRANLLHLTIGREHMLSRDVQPVAEADGRRGGTQ